MKLDHSFLASLALGSSLAASATAQTNSSYDHNWAPLADGPPSLVLDPQFFGADGDLGLGDAIRLCYSIDVTQGGRNQSGRTYLSHVSVSQGWGGGNQVPGINIGPVTIMARYSSDLRDDVCLVDVFDGAAGGATGPDVNLGSFGIQAGTGAYSFNDGFFWTTAFELLGSVLPSVANTGGNDPNAAFPTPLLAHLIYEIQGPVTGGPDDRQYFLASSSEVNGDGRRSGGVTNGNSDFGRNQYGLSASESGAVQGNRFLAEAGGQLESAAPLVLLGGSAGAVEFYAALAFQTPYLVGAKDGNDGSGGADWVVSASPTSVIDVRIVDRRAGAENALSGSTIANPNLVLNEAFVLFSATPARTMLQRPLSWDDLAGSLPPQAGTYSLPEQTVARVATPQRLHVNLDGTTMAFQTLGIGRTTPFSNAYDPLLDGTQGVTDYFNFGLGQLQGGTASLATGPLSLMQPTPNAKGRRIGIHAVGIQVDASRGTGLTLTEFTNARTAVLQ